MGVYAEKFRDPAVRLPDIVNVTGEEFYGKGYDDSDRRIPDITKARRLLSWEPRFGIREILEDHNAVLRFRVSKEWWIVRRPHDLRMSSF